MWWNLAHSLAQSSSKILEYWACWEKNHYCKTKLNSKLCRAVKSNIENFRIDYLVVKTLKRLSTDLLRKLSYLHKMSKYFTLMMAVQIILSKTKESKSAQVIMKAMKCVWQTKGHLIATQFYRQHSAQNSKASKLQSKVVWFCKINLSYQNIYKTLSRERLNPQE